MTPSKDLFNLVKSLTQAEKRYFKLWAGRHVSGEKNRYLVLFDYLDEQLEYREDVLLEHFKEEDFARNFSVVKAYLFDSILRCLQVFNAGKTVERQISDLFQQAEILYNKNLIKTAAKHLKKARKLAERFENKIWLLKVIELEKLLYKRQSYLGIKPDYFKKIEQEEEYLTSAIREGRRLKNKTAELVFQLVKFGGVTEEIVSETEQFIVKQTELKDFEDWTFSHQYFYYHLCSTFYYVTENYEETTRYLQTLIALIEAHPNMLTDNVDSYVSILTNYIIVNHKLMRFDGSFFKVIKKLKDMASDTKSDLTEPTRLKVLENTFNLELRTFSLMGEFEKGLNLCETAMATFTNRKGKVKRSQLAVFQFHYAYHHFALGDFDGAVRSLNELFKTETHNVRLDLQIYGRLLWLMAHSADGEQNFMESAVRSVARFVKQNGYWGKFERVFLKAFKKNLTMDDHKQVRNLTDKLESVFEDPTQAKVLDYIDVLSWLRSILSNRPFSEIVREDYYSLINHTK